MTEVDGVLTNRPPGQLADEAARRAAESGEPSMLETMEQSARDSVVSLDPSARQALRDRLHSATRPITVREKLRMRVHAPSLVGPRRRG